MVSKVQCVLIAEIGMRELVEGQALARMDIFTDSLLLCRVLSAEGGSSARAVAQLHKEGRDQNVAGQAEQCCSGQCLAR